MYFLGILLFLFFLVISTMMGSHVSVFIDAPSLIIILAFSLSMLMASGLMKDFVRCFRIMTQKENNCSLIELRKSNQSIKLMIGLLLTSGFLGSTIGAISLLSSLSDPATLGPNLAVTLLTFFYSILLVFILLPIKARVKAMILTIE